MAGPLWPCPRYPSPAYSTHTAPATAFHEGPPARIRTIKRYHPGFGAITLVRLPPRESPGGGGAPSGRWVPGPSVRKIAAGKGQEAPSWARINAVLAGRGRKINQNVHHSFFILFSNHSLFHWEGGFQMKLTAAARLVPITTFSFSPSPERSLPRPWGHSPLPERRAHKAAAPCVQMKALGALTESGIGVRTR